MNMLDAGDICFHENRDLSSIFLLWCILDHITACYLLHMDNLYLPEMSMAYISFMVHFRPHNCLLFTSYGQSIFTRNVNVPSAMNKVASLFLDLGDLKVSTQLTLPFTVLSQKANGINICIDHLCILFNRLTSFMPSSFGYLVVTQLLPLTSASLFRETRCL